MSSRGQRTRNDVLFYDVHAALCEAEEDFGVQIHFIHRLDVGGTRNQRFVVSVLACIVGKDAERQTVARQDTTFPTADGRSLWSVELSMLHSLYYQLETRKLREEASNWMTSLQ